MVEPRKTQKAAEVLYDQGHFELRGLGASQDLNRQHSQICLTPGA